VEYNFLAYKNQFDKDEFAKSAGIMLAEASPGHAVAKMEVTPKHLNSVGTLHGGAIFTLADFVFAVASNTHGKIAMAINTEISFFKAVRSGTITAVAIEISLHEKLSTYLVEITDETGSLIAHFKGTAYRRSEMIHYQEYKDKT
jgi:acyl-CoA thioesterase